MAFVSVNPATGAVIERFDNDAPAAVERRLAAAADAFQAWRRRPLSERATVLGRAAGLMERERDRLGAIATREMGKLLSAAVAEVDKCALACRFFAENADHMMADEDLKEPGGVRELIRYEPLGTILAVMPWNFPYWQMMRFAAPGLAAGNVALWKPAATVAGCTRALCDLFHRAGAPEGVLQALLVEHDEIPAIIADDRVAAVTLTGSERAGGAVAAAAGKALKKTVLELGGSDPFIVLASADLDAAVTTAVKARMVNNGQSCIAAKRFIVEGSIYQAFAERFVAAVAALKVGDPMDAGTDVGPLSTGAMRDGLASQVERSVAAGARLATGGTIPPGPGFYFTPAVLTDIPPSAPAAREELFGPVASLFRARDRADALRIANDTPFGLGASVFTRDADDVETCSRELACGMVFINDMVASDPRFAFGGIKRSGYGRELGSHGLRELVNVKRVRIKPLDA
jgi:succinate-semialdehyde dehydrogenase / glutarate-semialdehyde dehydrogenase